MKNTKSAFFSAIFVLLFFSLTAQATDNSQFSKQIDRLFNEQITSSTPGAAVVVTQKGMVGADKYGG